MNILITAGASVLAHDLAQALSPEHTVRLTDTESVQTRWSFVRCDLGHDAATDHLVDGVDVLIHLAALPPAQIDSSEESANHQLDFHTRCTYNLLHAASAAGVPRCIYASSLSIFANCDDDWAVNEKWRPRPTTEPQVLAPHLGEFVCREFAREGRLAVTCLRLGTLGASTNGAAQPPDQTWLSYADAGRAFQCALAAPPEPWGIYHIQSEFPGARFTTQKAR
ncbi:MAG: NAD(P)-dependent oxidoreductase, partial [Chloroflexota bacterium]|nr:NAD(P)-dependent oxidoreductase [Chloroflexota bacterium]